MRTAYSQGDYMEVFSIAETKNGTVDADRSTAVTRLYRRLAALGRELKEAYVHPALVRVRMAQLERWRF